MDYTPKLREIVMSLPFGDRIDLLEQGRDLGYKAVGKVKGQEILPNCFGTALFVLDIEKPILRIGKVDTTEEAVRVNAHNFNRFALFPKGFDRPGSVQPNIMDDYLRSRQFNVIDSPRPGDLMTTSYAFTNSQGIRREEVVHATVFLGEFAGKPLVFEQIGLGEGFCFSEAYEVRSRGGVNTARFYRFRKN